MSKFWNREFFYYLSLFTQLGLTMMGNILASLFLYLGFAKYIFRHPLILFLFLLFGIMSAYYQVYKLITRKKGKEKRRGRHQDDF
ncbi:MAG: AtpZ/AtpI family protein [Fusobacterium necrophorum]|nr:AtpZ/AtpI family protein [Fusobacterium necrophorum]